MNAIAAIGVTLMVIVATAVVVKAIIETVNALDEMRGEDDTADRDSRGD